MAQGIFILLGWTETHMINCLMGPDVTGVTKRESAKEGERRVVDFNQACWGRLPGRGDVCTGL